MKIEKEGINQSKWRPLVCGSHVTNGHYFDWLISPPLKKNNTDEALCAAQLQILYDLSLLQYLRSSGPGYLR